MADLRKDSLVESGEKPKMAEDAYPQTNAIDTATVLDESSGGQSDKNRDKVTNVGGDVPISQPNHAESESSGDEKVVNVAPNDLLASDVPKATDTIDEGIQLGTEPEPKKKKKRSKAKKKGAAARKGVTGFEEFYADAPMTPAEAILEKNEIYSKSKPFPERIEECIQRYRANRRMSSERTMLFNKYLWLGGIDASQRQFTGFAEDREAIDEADADEVRQMTATDFVGGSGHRFYDPSNSEHWFVDFEGIAKGFLSRIVPAIYMYDEEANKLAADLVKNFLNYILMHGVCPEYKTDIMAARRLCEAAPIELRMMHELIQELPGQFNTTCKELFCNGDVWKYKGGDGELYDKILSFRICVLASAKKWIRDGLLKSIDPRDVRVVQTTEKTFEVVDTIFPDPGEVVTVAEELEALGKKDKGRLAGFLLVKPAIIDHGFNNEVRSDQLIPKDVEPDEFLLEPELLAKLQKGMKIKAMVCELNIGLQFMKEIEDVRVSFDQFLPQMLMEGWKDPVPNERPPPSVAHPDAEEKAMAAELAADAPDL